MYKFVVLAALFAVSQANYGGYGGGLGGGLGGGFGGGAIGPLAVNTRQMVNYYPVQSTGYARPTSVFVDSIGAPVNIISRSLSSPVNLQHVHVPSPGSFRATSSQDGAHVRVHTVTKPIIQEVREIIAPQRIIRQQVLPVQEEVQTIVARGVAAGGFAGAIGGGAIGGGLIGFRG